MRHEQVHRSRPQRKLSQILNPQSHPRKKQQESAMALRRSPQGQLPPDRMPLRQLRLKMILAHLHLEVHRKPHRKPHRKHHRKPQRKLHRVNHPHLSLLLIHQSLTRSKRLAQNKSTFYSFSVGFLIRFYYDCVCF